MILAYQLLSKFHFKFPVVCANTQRRNERELVADVNKRRNEREGTVADVNNTCGFLGKCGLWPC